MDSLLLPDPQPWLFALILVNPDPKLYNEYCLPVGTRGVPLHPLRQQLQLVGQRQVLQVQRLRSMP